MNSEPRNALALVFFVATAMAASLSLGLAKQMPQAPPKFTAGVDVVEMDVSVLDKDHKPVRGLAASEFHVFEDGKPRAIVAFTPVEIPPAAPQPAGWMRDVTPDVESNDIAEHRMFVIILDDSLNAKGAQSGGPSLGPQRPDNSAWKVTQTKLAAKKAIEGLGSGDEAAIIFTAAGWDGQGFTQDHRKLLAAVDRMRLTPPVGSLCAPLWGSTDALQAAAEALAAIPHRKKVVLYISVGPPVRLVGKPDDPVCEPHAQGSAQAALRAAQLGDVVFYGIDPKGLTGAGITDKSLNFLDDFSSNTGGRMIARTNDIVSHVQEILDESSSYYLIGYELTTQESDGRFHRLEVKVDRPGVEVQARKSRFDPKPPEPGKPKPMLSPTETAIGDFLPSTALRVEASVAPFASSAESPVTEVAIGARLPADARPMNGDQIDLLMKAFSVDGREVGTVQDLVPVAIERVSSGPAAGAGAVIAVQQFELSSRIHLKPGRYTLRIAVRSKALNKTGGVYTDVVVPDFTKEPLSLSGVVITESSGSSLRGDALSTLTPTTTRAFGADDRLQAFLRVYQGGSQTAASVAMRIRIVDVHQKAVVDRVETLPATAFSRDRRADYWLRLPLSSLTTGDYWLSLEATMGKATARRDVRFSVK